MPTYDAADQAVPVTYEPSGWGEKFTWKSGVAVELSKPAECQPSEHAVPTKIDRAVKVTVIVLNDSDEPVNTVKLAPSGDAVFNDKKAEAISDFEGGCGEGIEAVTVLPGKTYKFDAGYAVGSKAGELQLVVDPLFGKQAIFVGKA